MRWGTARCVVGVLWLLIALWVGVSYWVFTFAHPEVTEGEKLVEPLRWMLWGW